MSSPLPFDEKTRQKLDDASSKYLELIRGRLSVAFEGARDFDDKLVQLCVHSWMNIMWYEGSVDDLRSKNNDHLAAIYGVVVLAFAAAMYLVVTRGAAESALAALLAGLPLLAALAKTVDRRADIAAFHAAASQLKALYYAFEDSWAKSQDRDGFSEALDQVIRASREVVDAETTAFFKRMAGPVTVVDAATALAKSGFLANLGKVASPSQATVVATTRRKQAELDVENARIELEAARGRVAALGEDATDAEREAATKKVREATGELAARRAALHAILG